MRSLVILCSAAAVATVSLFAQATATLQGTITDSSGATVPAARIAATNLATGLSRTTESNSAGQYVIPLLPVGTYRVQISKSGFQTATDHSVILQADTNVQVSTALLPANVNETIEVSAQASLLQTAASNLVQVVDSRRVVDLPLNGRNVLQLMAINAGVADRGATGGTLQSVTLAQGAYHVPVSINGSRGNGTNFLLDNADNNDGYTNISQVFPNPDAVQEFSLQTSTFDAQYGRGVGGVVNVVTKSGGNRVHGSAFEFLRNYEMNAGNFFTGRDTLKRNQFGFTAGGPLLIPRMYNGRNRTFWFGSYQGTRSVTANPGKLAVAASDAMKAGDFSHFLAAGGTGVILDPDSRLPLPDNRIPQTKIDPVSRNLLKFMPSSSDASYQLRYPSPPTHTDDDQILVRGDHNFSETNRVSLRYFLFDYNRPWVYMPDNYYSIGVGQTARAHNLTLNHFYAFSPTLINTLTIGFTRTTPQATTPDDLRTTYKSLGARVNVIDDFPTLTLSISNWTGLDLGFGYTNFQDNYQISDTVSWVRGKHSIRVGGDYRRMRLDIASYWRSGGTASFSGQLFSNTGKVNAGNAYAEFLMGRVQQWIQQSYRSWSIGNTFFDLYFQDDIRLTKKLTVNLGLRWDPKFDITEADNKRTTFQAGVQSIRFPKAATGLLFPGDPGIGDKIIPNDWNNLAPRIGLAYQIRPSTVIRAAYGYFYDQYPAIFNNRTLAAEPYARVVTMVAPGLLSNVYGSGTPIEVTPVRADSNFQFSPYGTYAVPVADMRAGEMQNWNFVVEQEWLGTLFRGAYVGSRGTHLLHSPEINYARWQPGATSANINQRRLYANLGQLQIGQSVAWSKYHAFQFTVDRRFSRNFSILANYTWSKSIDIASYGSVEANSAGPNPANYHDNQGLSDFDMPHRFVVSGLYELPRWPSDNAFIKYLINGWRVNPIATFETGTPLTVVSGIDADLNDVTGDFADYLGGSTQIPGSRSKAAQILRYFDTSRYRTAAPGTFGTGRRNQVRRPGLWNIDASLYKELPVTEQIQFQLRAEAFNMLNHANLGPPNVTATSTLFGRITSADAPRIMQLALKLIF